jgi:hypothetical protein
MKEASISCHTFYANRSYNTTIHPLYSQPLCNPDVKFHGHNGPPLTLSLDRTVQSSGAPPPPPKFRSYDKAESNSQFRRKYVCNSLIRIRGSLICKLSGTPDYGATAPDPRFLCLLSSTEFVEPSPTPEKNSWCKLPPSPKKNSWVRHWFETWM